MAQIVVMLYKYLLYEYIHWIFDFVNQTHRQIHQFKSTSMLKTLLKLWSLTKTLWKNTVDPIKCITVYILSTFALKK